MESLSACGGPGLQTRRDDRREAMLDAAETLFIERGFQRTSLAEVVRRSGGSLATLYALFTSKYGLLRAVMSRAKEARLAGVTDLMAAEASGCEALKLFAHRLNDFLTDAPAVAMMRIVIEETMRDPAFGHAFYCEGRDERVRHLAALLRRWVAAGRARIDAPDEAAELFLAVVLSDIQMNAMMGAAVCEREAAQARIDFRVEHFCRGFGIE